MRASLLGVAAVASTALAVHGVVPAQAANSSTKLPLTKGGMYSASLRASDVPASFGNNLDRALSYTSGSATEQFEMCVDKNGNKVFGARPAQHANSSIPLSQTGAGNNITATVAVSSDIYGYASTKSATKHWKQLKKATSRCAKQLNKPIDVSGVSVNANVYQQYKRLQKDCGHPGFRIAQQVEVDVASGAPGGLTIYVGGYSVYRQVGTSILRVQFANYTQASAVASKIKPKWASFTRSEATRIANRVSRLPIR